MQHITHTKAQGYRAEYGEIPQAAALCPWSSQTTSISNVTGILHVGQAFLGDIRPSLPPYTSK